MEGERENKREGGREGFSRNDIKSADRMKVKLGGSRRKRVSMYVWNSESVSGNRSVREGG